MDVHASFSSCCRHHFMALCPGFIIAVIIIVIVIVSVIIFSIYIDIVLSFS